MFRLRKPSLVPIAKCTHTLVRHFFGLNEVCSFVVVSWFFARRVEGGGGGASGNELNGTGTVLVVEDAMYCCCHVVVCSACGRIFVRGQPSVVVRVLRCGGLCVRTAVYLTNCFFSFFLEYRPRYVSIGQRLLCAPYSWYLYVVAEACVSFSCFALLLFALVLQHRCSGKLCNQLIGAEAVCPHVSERREDFFVLGLDVKGKRSITESLQLYVEGEVRYSLDKTPPPTHPFKGRWYQRTVEPLACDIELPPRGPNLCMLAEREPHAVQHAFFFVHFFRWPQPKHAGSRRRQQVPLRAVQREARHAEAHVHRPLA